jgi:hypothetical protein
MQGSLEQGIAVPAFLRIINGGTRGIDSRRHDLLPPVIIGSGTV